ncbi:acetyl-CoA acetyltransferase [Chlorobiota bacterium]|nr:acetyl-CoA acetyltransferase [Chlorobiota bacterium]
MQEVYIIEPLRTPVGKYGGALSSIRPDDLGAHVIKAVVQSTGINPEAIDDVIFGCANQAGEDNRNIARMSALLAGLPYSVPGVTVNRLCASSLEAIIQGARAIKSGEAEVLIVGGVESMSRAPYSFPKNATGSALFGNLTAFDTALGWRYPNPSMASMFPLESMGETAENLVGKFGISREDQDAFALASHQRAVMAQQAGHFAEEIIPIAIPKKKGDPVIISSDEQPRSDASLEALGTLSPAFRKGGSVTAGNASSLNDGAVAMMLASGEAVKKYALKPIARYVASGTAGVDPRIMGIGPVYAIRKALEKANMHIDDIGLFELNEAFASQALACIRELGISTDKVNIHGGAIAIGHPLGMSGGRIAGHLARTMQKQEIRFGIASLCIGVGQGLAMIIEKTDTH